MMIAVVTKFKLSSLKLYPSFFRQTLKARHQAKKAEGAIYVSLNPFTLSTLTVWESRKAMIAYRNSGAHGAAMKTSHLFGHNASHTWEVSEVPTWRDAKTRLKREGEAKG